ncbi:RING finger protein ETP1-like protein [Golovinomyces cichoracearum]|uniref:RING finger protein ETP1-like protein n=1 Tax=Golovinomyces cichoracearum TaxID=62708 RepID=A0A420IRC3_9PEZI|nr:RING finger protein ETP1-like protein [Golovinomyces cichoracearum]
MVHSYNYHLRFELYPFNSTTINQKIKRSEKDLRSEVWIPPPNSDIFSTDNWPIHDSIEPLGIAKGEEVEGVVNFALNSQESKNRQENLLNLERDIRLSNRSLLSRGLIDCGPNKALGRNAILKSDKNIVDCGAFNRSESLLVAEKDWRFGQTVISGFDVKMRNDVEKDDERAKDETQKANWKSLGESSSKSYGDSFISGLTPEGRRTGKVTKARFEPITGKSTHVGWGIVHLYRDDEDSIFYESGTTTHERADESTVLCIPAVPNYLTPNYFLAWVGEKTREQISHIRMVMTGQLMRYLVLMKFRDGKAAKIWKETWDGRQFNSIEPETCHVVFIKTISFSKSPLTTTPSSASFPALTHDPFTPTVTSLIELPTCPVCLERMDDTTGLLTILCQHVFHCACLLKWKDSTCPVCRQTNSFYLDLPQERPFGSGEASICNKCDCADDLWICLICGNIGCGRYKKGHAKEHWKETAHCFALEIETQHVWDYAGDTWVHRLIRDKGDNSKLIEMPSGTRSDYDTLSTNQSNEDLIPRNKLEVLSIEYTHLLTSQLESHRLYFEDLIKKSATKTATASSEAISAVIEASKLSEDLRKLEDAHAAIKAELTSQNRELERERNRAEKSAEMARSFSKDLIEERRVSEGLMQRIEHLNKNIASILKEKEAIMAENSELRDTNRDLIFYLSAGKKVEELEANEDSGLVQGELRSGVISLPDVQQEVKENQKKRSKGKGKGKERHNCT